MLRFLVNTLADNYAARKVVEVKTRNLKGAVSSNESLVTKLAGSNKFSEAVRAKVVSLKVWVARADVEVAQWEKVVSKVCEKPG